MTEVSNSTRRRADNSGNRADVTYKNLSLHDLTAQFYLKLLLITQHEVPFISTSRKRQERSSDRTENGKCTNVTNGIQLTPFYTFFSNVPDGKNGFSNDALSPPEVKFTPQNLQMVFF